MKVAESKWKYSQNRNKWRRSLESIWEIPKSVKKRWKMIKKRKKQKRRRKAVTYKTKDLLIEINTVGKHTEIITGGIPMT